MNSSVYRKERKNQGKNIMERAIALLCMAALVAGVAFGMAGEPAYAASNDLTIKSDWNSAMQNDKDVSAYFTVKNSGASAVTSYFKYEEESSGVSVVGGTANVTLATGEEANPYVKVDISRNADTSTHKVRVTAYSDSAHTTEIGSGTISIDVSENKNTQLGAAKAAVDVNYKLSNPDGIVVDADNTLTLEIFNRGNTVIKNAQISLGLPDGMSINNAAGYINAGYIAIGDTYKCKFPIVADDTLTSKNYAIAVKIKGGDSSNADVSLEQTLYIPVKGTKAAAAAKDMEISGISIPQQVIAGDDFTLTFNVANRGTNVLNDTKVTVEMPEGVANKTKNVFIISKLAAGASERCSITLFATDKAADNEYKLIKITAEAPSGDKTVSINQYAGTMVKSLGGNAKTPQLMVSDYNFGGSYVQAGNDFALKLTLYNTSATQDLVNVKVTVSADEGAFIPVKSSNSFYVDKIASKDSATQGILMTSKRDAAEKTVALTVDMSYEDKAGNAFTAKDTISIPIMQQTRLVVDDIVQPPELYPGMQSGMSVNFYNMGKTVLNNLRVNVEGDFDSPQSNMYYVGNMETGKSDSYDFAFIPRQSGPMTGTIIFTYEDSAGAEQRLEKPFEMTIMEEMVMPEDPGAMNPEMQEKPVPWKPIAAVAAVAAAVIGGLLFKRYRRKKKDREMEIDE